MYNYNNKLIIMDMNVYNRKRNRINTYHKTTFNTYTSIPIDMNNITLNNIVNDDKNNDKKIDTTPNQPDLSSLPKEVSVGAIVYNIATSSILLIQGLNHFYGFPKGHIEDGETEIDTMKREILEETNIDLSNFKHTILDSPITQEFYLKRKHIDSRFPTEVNRVNIFYVVLVNDDLSSFPIKKQEEEIISLNWCSIPCAKTLMYRTRSNQLSILKDAVNMIKSFIDEKVFKRAPN